MQVLLTAEPNIMHYDALWHFWYTLYFYCNFFICLVFSMFLYIQTHFKLFNSATRTVSILISLKIQNTSASFSSMSFPTCLLSKSTNRVVILRNSFSGLYWMQFTGSLIFLLLGLCPCVGVSREKVRGRYICWDRACLKMFFSPSCLLFGYVANLDKKKKFHSESWGCFSSVFKRPVLLLTNLRPFWWIILCASPPPMVFWNFTNGVPWYEFFSFALLSS